MAGADRGRPAGMVTLTTPPPRVVRQRDGTVLRQRKPAAGNAAHHFLAGQLAWMGAPDCFHPVSCLQATVEL